MHTHVHADEQPAPREVRRILSAALIPVVLATLIGLVVLWPDDTDDLSRAELGFDAELVDAVVVDVDLVPCAMTRVEDEITCNRITARLEEGAEAGSRASFEFAATSTSVTLDVGDRIVLAHAPDAPPDLAYQFADFQRDRPLLLLGLIFAGAVVALGRWRGLRALAGLAVSFLVLVWFVLPSILDGNNALAVSLVGSSAIMLAALYLAHGYNARTTTAVLGTAASLSLIGVLALVFVAATELTGLASEEATLLRISAEQVNLEGLILGGIVIGALGVLDDVTVTQVSAVWELHLANPQLSGSELYRAAVRIGRDHIASTVNTLVLAYAGASLPLLILFVEVDRGLGDVITGETVAVEVVRTLVGSVGLVASVPITTGLAVLVITRGAGLRPRGRRFSRPRLEEEWRESGVD